MNWVRIGVKFLVGIITSVVGTTGYTYYIYKANWWDVMYFDTKTLFFKFVLFFWLGYFVIGNSFAPGKKNTWK